MPSSTLTPEVIAELRRLSIFRHTTTSNAEKYGYMMDQYQFALLDAAEERDRLRAELAEARRQLGDVVINECPE